MPTSEAGRRAAFAELSRRKKGGSARNFEGMGTDRLEKYAHEPLHKKGGGGGKKKKKGAKSYGADDQAMALRRASAGKEE